MWYAIIILILSVIALGTKIISLGCNIDEIRSKRCDVTDCERYVDDIWRKHNCFSHHEGQYTHEADVKAQIRQLEGMEHIRCNMEKQMRLNASFCDYKNRDITIKKALDMLFDYLGLGIEICDDVKIIKKKKEVK